MYKPIIEGTYGVTRDTRVIPIVIEHEEDDIQWTCNMSISMNSREPNTIKETMSRPNGNLWKMSAISTVNKFLSRKAWIAIKRIKVKSKGGKPVSVM